MRVVLNHKLVLADRLTRHEANTLITQIRNRMPIQKYFDDSLFMESIGPEHWRITMHMPYTEAFTKNPHDFIFDL